MDDQHKHLLFPGHHVACHWLHCGRALARHIASLPHIDQAASSGDSADPRGQQGGNQRVPHAHLSYYSTHTRGAGACLFCGHRRLFVMQWQRHFPVGQLNQQFGLMQPKHRKHHAVLLLQVRLRQLDHLEHDHVLLGAVPVDTAAIQLVHAVLGAGVYNRIQSDGAGGLFRHMVLVTVKVVVHSFHQHQGHIGVSFGIGGFWRLSYRYCQVDTVFDKFCREASKTSGRQQSRHQVYHHVCVLLLQMLLLVSGKVSQVYKQECLHYGRHLWAEFLQERFRCIRYYINILKYSFIFNLISFLSELGLKLF